MASLIRDIHCFTTPAQVAKNPYRTIERSKEDRSNRRPGVQKGWPEGMRRHAQCHRSLASQKRL
jgi:hypothetical protein